MSNPHANSQAILDANMLTTKVSREKPAAGHVNLSQKGTESTIPLAEVLFNFDAQDLTELPNLRQPEIALQPLFSLWEGILGHFIDQNSHSSKPPHFDFL